MHRLPHLFARLPGSETVKMIIYIFNNTFTLRMKEND